MKKRHKGRQACARRTEGQSGNTETHKLHEKGKESRWERAKKEMKHGNEAENKYAGNQKP